MKLDRERTALLVVDVQERLFPHIHSHPSGSPDPLADELVRLVRGALALEIPIVVTEQYTKGLGPTIAPLRDALAETYAPLEKMAFSACGDEAIVATLERTGCRHVLLAGIETHVCIYQSAIDLIARGYHVHLVVDAVGSRSAENRELGIRRIEDAGGVPTGVEMALFELLGTSGTDEFRAISALVK